MESRPLGGLGRLVDSHACNFNLSREELEKR